MTGKSGSGFERALPSIPQFGAAQQIGFFVDDVEAAAWHWHKTCGIGPFFFREHLEHAEWIYQGQISSPKPDITIGISYMGDLQIELVTVKNDAPCVYSKWRREGRFGLAHMARFCDDIESTKALFAPIPIVESTRAPDGLETIYLDTFDQLGWYVEFIQYSAAAMARRERTINTVRNWDGSRPVRYIDPKNPAAVYT